MSGSAATSSMPTWREASAWARVMAGPARGSAVPRTTLRWATPGNSQGAATPTSTMRCWMRFARQKAQMAAPPKAMLAIIWGVTSWG